MKFIFFPISWILFLTFRIVVILLGYIMVPIAVLLRCHHVRKSRIFKDRDIVAFKNDLFWLWGNEEEGIGWYGSGSLSKRILYSEIIRNPANNLRYVPFISLKIIPNKVRWIGSLGNFNSRQGMNNVYEYDRDEVEFWSLVWCGLYSNFRVHFPLKGKRYRFWIGWKIYPEDMYGVKGQRAMSAGFATQLKRIDG